MAATKTQLDLIETSFETSKAANALFCHQEFLEKLAEHERDSIGRRTAFLLQRLAVDARRLHYKSTAGVNRGWRRSRLGGNHGSHFYAWWAPKNALPLKDFESFSNVPDGSVFLRFNRSLGAWTNRHVALYDELYAHMVGDALPVSIGRFAGSKSPRVSDKAYRERRTRFLGEGPALSALDAAARLERLDSTRLADRYFPELALAWRAVEKLRAGGELTGAEFDCLAVDECQDLTPIEALLLIELTRKAAHDRRNVPFLAAGDEAQTVRPTDFEWAWLSDLLHAQLGTPMEYKLAANLRSPQRIAELVNRVWDFYSQIQKHERPSGTGYAEIEDDATDQILYCSSTPGPELSELLVSLSTREGLALISLEDNVPSYVPEAARGAVLTVSEAKGLDFHSVCILDGGMHVDRILRDEERYRGDSDLEGLRKRLAIDQLRVALSRPTERLIWLDINPTDQVVRQAVSFLNGGYLENGVGSCVPSALLKTPEEDELDPEERVQRCQADARQYLEVKPEMAWSRAQQAVTLLGRYDSPAAVTDKTARDAAHLTLAEVCFTLGLRNVKLPAELGRPDLFEVASRAARNAHRFGLSRVIDSIGRVQRTMADMRLNALVEFAQVLPENKSEIEGWLSVQLAAISNSWMETLESALFNGRNAGVLLQVLPPFYEALDLADRETRTQRLRQRAAQLLIKDKQFASALIALRALPESQPKMEAICHEGLADFRSAAQSHLAAGNTKDALNCYRAIPDMREALKLAQEIGHPAAESLEWISQLQEIVGKRPEKFTKQVTAAEKKTLEELLEQALGVTRRKPATRKAAVKKTATKKTSAPKSSARRPAKDYSSERNPYF